MGTRIGALHFAQSRLNFRSKHSWLAGCSRVFDGKRCLLHCWDRGRSLCIVIFLRTEASDSLRSQKKPAEWGSILQAQQRLGGLTFSRDKR